MRLAPAILLLMLSSLATAAPPSLSDPRLLPGDDAIGPAWGDQSAPAIARLGDAYLAVWSDARAEQGKWDVYGIRLDAGGSPLDAVAFAIGDADGTQVTPAVASNGTDWLVAWLDEGSIATTRVTASGTVTGAASLIATPGAGASLALASDGTGWAVAWAGTSAGNADVRGARIAPDGSVLDPGGVVILPETFFVRGSFALAFATDRWLLAWPESTSDRGWDVVGHTLSASLAPREPAPLRLASSVDDDGAPALASNGSAFYLAWKQQDRSGWVNGISGTIVDREGVAATPDGTPVGDRRSWGDLPSVAWDGVQWHVAWAADGVFVARVSEAGSVLDPLGVRVSSSATFDLRDPAITGAASGGARVAWQDYRGRRENDIWAAGIDAAGAPSTDAAISLGLPSQQDPRLAWNGDGYGLAFLSRTPSGARVLVARLDADGVPIGTEPLEVASGDLVEPGIAWSGSRYLVTWQDRSGVRVKARRLAPDLTPQDAAPIDVMAGENPSVAALSDTFLVTAEYYGASWQFRDVNAQRLDGATGALIGSPIPILGAFAWGSTVGTVGDRWLVAWEGHQAHDDTIFRIGTSFIGADGVVADASGLAGGSGWGTSGLSIASHASAGAIAYSTTRAPSASNGEIFLVRIGADATLPDGPDGVPVTSAGGEQLGPNATWDGTQFVVAFEDTRQRPGLFLFPRTDIYAARMAADGTPLDPPAGFAVEEAAVPERQPAVAGAGGRSVIVASRLIGPTAAALRIGIRGMAAAAPVLPPVDRLRWTDATTLAWDEPAPNLLYDVMRGTLSVLWSANHIGDAACVADDHPVPGLPAPEPAGPGGLYFFVRADKAGVPAGTYDDVGTAGTPQSRDAAAGPAGCGDLP